MEEVPHINNDWVISTDWAREGTSLGSNGPGLTLRLEDLVARCVDRSRSGVGPADAAIGLK